MADLKVLEQIPPKQHPQQESLLRLLEIVAMLRHPEFGCPWDLKQSIDSLIPFTIEEVYEVVDAIQRNDMIDLQDELGDLLFQIVFYAQLAKEDGSFDFNDIADAISDKLVRRHPHVFPQGRVDLFGHRQAISAEQVVDNWEAIKQTEREAKRINQGESVKNTTSSIFDNVPQALPALERARKLQKRAAREGFEWKSKMAVLAKLKEEVAELEEALAGEDSAAVQAELGDVLFTAVNLARHLDAEPEQALRESNKRFESRVRKIEFILQEQGRSLQNALPEELDKLWEEAKRSGL
ncbi:MAG: nucleoside triphosphate pyrophosphohydrolase [Gammaproteobacteria bacterium]|nr:nucleoside triphosphate pyrophosphohydrolase [Gammaproteobacteria bacterium]